MGYFIKISAFVVNIQKVGKVIMIGQIYIYIYIYIERERERES